MEQSFSLPMIIVIAHVINLFCLVILIRSGIQILFDHPKLYWTDNTRDDNHWLRFGKKIMPKDKLWTSLDEAEDPGKLALPGGNHNLGSARHWHFTTAIVWVITGIVYLVFLLLSGQWERIVPTEWGIFGEAVNVFFTYLSLNVPPETASYNALQQLTYAGIVFVLTPITILTGLAMSPALVARFPWFLNLFGGRRQVARSFHFICMVAFSVFILTHITITLLLHFYDSIKLFTFGNLDVDFAKALTYFVGINSHISRKRIFFSRHQNGIVKFGEHFYQFLRYFIARMNT